MHYHPFQEEHFEVLNGMIRVEIGGQQCTYEAGDRFTVPMGTHHWMHNTGSELGKVIWQVRPAFKMETFFETLWGLAIDGKTNDNGKHGIAASLYKTIPSIKNRMMRLKKINCGID